MTTCDGESTAVWNQDPAFLDTVCDDVGACTEPHCKEGPTCEKPLARSTGPAPLVTTADVFVCFYATNLCYFRLCKNGNANKVKLIFRWNPRVLGISRASLAGGGRR